MNLKEINIFRIFKLVNVLFFADIPTQVPPLTPGTNKTMTEALKASFASWEKEQIRLNITKGKHFTFPQRISYI